MKPFLYLFIKIRAETINKLDNNNFLLLSSVDVF